MTTLARLTCDEPTARRLAASLEHRLGDVAVIAAFEDHPPHWAVEITFADDADQAHLRELVEAQGGDPATLQFSDVAERDWVALSLAGLKPVRAGNFIVHGAHDRGTFPANLLGIEIEAALAFGTGHHGTTRGCLLALHAIAKSSKRRRRAGVLDTGTGTGVLAMAAAKAFRRSIFATDIDIVAVQTAQANARKNGVAPFVTIRQADARRALPWFRSFDLIFANILLAPLVRMAGPLTRRLAPGGQIVLSGLLPAQANAARTTYQAHGLTLERRLTIDNWVTLVMRRGAKRNRLGEKRRGGFKRPRPN